MLRSLSFKSDKAGFGPKSATDKLVDFAKSSRWQWPRSGQAWVEYTDSTYIRSWHLLLGGPRLPHQSYFIYPIDIIIIHAILMLSKI